MFGCSSGLPSILGLKFPVGGHDSGYYVLASSGILFGFPSGDTGEANIVFPNTLTHILLTYPYP